MGCTGTSNGIDVTESFAIQRISYINRNDKLERFTLDILDDSLKKQNATDEGIRAVVEEIKFLKGGTGPMTLEELKQSVRDIFVQQILLHESIVVDIDIQSELEEKFINLNLKTEEGNVKDLMTVLTSIFIDFEQNQRAIIISNPPSYYIEDNSLINSYYNNLKFNKSFMVDCLVLNMEKELLHDKKSCKMLSDVILCNRELCTVIVNLPKGEISQEEINNLNPIISAVKMHGNLKAFVFINQSENLLNLNKTMTDEIKGLLQNNQQLQVFGLIKFEFKSEFLEELEKVIPFCMNLKCVCLESYSPNVNALDKFVVKGIGRCSSLLIFLLAGYYLSPSKVSEYQQVRNINLSHRVKYFAYLPSFSF